MTIKYPTNVQKVTNEWIVNNFDIDKERRIVKHKTSEREVYLFRNEGTYTLDDVIKEIRDTANDLGVMLDNATIKFRVGTDWTECCCDEGTMAVYVFAEYEAPETDSKVISRLKSRVKQKIKRERDKIKRAEKKAQAEAKEVEELKKLIKKYGKGDVVNQLIKELQ